MKKLFVMILIVISILSACNSSKLSFKEIDNVPNRVQDKIDPNLRLQSINVKNGSYIIFHSIGEVEAALDTRGDTVIIKFNVNDSEHKTVNQNVYYLTTGSLHEVIEVQVDGKSIPFDGVTN